MSSILRRGRVYFKHNARYCTQATTYATTVGNGDGGKVLKIMSFFAAFPSVGAGMLNCACFTHHDRESYERPSFRRMAHEIMHCFPRDEDNEPLFHNPHHKPVTVDCEDN